MTRFNPSPKKASQTVNYEDEKAYKLTPELELYSLVCTAIVQNKFYEKAGSQINRLRQLVEQCSPLFVAKLAVYAREQMYLRTIPVVLAVELAEYAKGNGLLSKLLERVIQRADEITETLAYYQLANARKGTKKLNKLSNQVKKGISKAFHKFDEYQFAKYNRDGEVKLRDALFLSHAKPSNDKEKELFKKITDNTLEVPYTWEVELSKLGQQKFETEEAKREAIKTKWEELIDSKKLGYMATLRNLRNILDANIDNQHIVKVCDYLANPIAVKKSRQLPFRFFSAYTQLENNKSFNTEKVMEALETAIKISIENVPGVDGNVLIACDVSGSMESTISPRSVVSYYDIGLILGQLLKLKTPSNMLGIFGDIFKVKRFTSKSVLQNTLRLHEIEGEVGYSTNGYKVIDYLNKEKIKVDKIFIFTDNQMWNSYGTGRHFQDAWREYRNNISPKAELHLFDMSGYGNTPVKVQGNGVYLIAGWSEKIFAMLEALKQGKTAVDVINQIQI